MDGGPFNEAVPMEIRNVEGNVSFAKARQRKEDLARNACFTCHKVGYRPWKHKKDKSSINNLVVSEASSAVDSDEHENESKN